jgi:hypothetical protein
MPPQAHGWRPSQGGPSAPPPSASGGGPTIDLIKNPRIRDQGVVGCCVSIAITGALELLLRDATAYPELSPMFHYYVARPNPGALTSLSLLDGLQVAVDDGVCSQRLHPAPITPEGARQRPSDAALADAKERAGAEFDPVIGVMRGRFEFFRLPDFDRRRAWLATLNAGWPVLIGFWQTPGHRAITAQAPRHGELLRPREAIGHAALVVGYHRGRGFRVADAKGRGFGKGGTWWLADDLLETPLLQESWYLKPSS